MLLGISLELESKLGIRVWDEESNVRVVLLNRIAWVGLLGMSGTRGQTRLIVTYLHLLLL